MEKNKYEFPIGPTSDPVIKPSREELEALERLTDEWIKEELIKCEECGKVVVETFLCESCGKLICRDCGTYTSQELHPGLVKKLGNSPLLCNSCWELGS